MVLKNLQGRRQYRITVDPSASPAVYAQISVQLSLCDDIKDELGDVES